MVDDDDIDGVVERVNSFLPSDVVLHGAAKVSRHFSARWEGSSRAYLYVLPSYCASRTTAERVRGALECLGCEHAQDLGPEGSRELEDLAGLRAVRLQSEELELLRSTLRCFEGNRYFANFTVAKTTNTSSKSWRIIREISCGDPFVHNGREWLPISVRGDSFMTYQIRKMLGAATLEAQGVLPADFVTAALDRHVACVTPRLPPSGLMFLRPYFRCQRAEPVQTAIDSLLEGASMRAWREQLQLAIVEGDGEACLWARWMAIIVQYQVDTCSQALQALTEHEAAQRRQLTRIAEKKAGACQVAAIVSGSGRPLWVGRNNWVGR
mmetsp:Transcript_31458/g.72974  ORF Transcript_31458/g.72974 Transcript_31458/m.72974 type:complete len:324 (+) Transcript_31458:399-1370(+)